MLKKKKKKILINGFILMFKNSFKKNRKIYLFKKFLKKTFMKRLFEKKNFANFISVCILLSKYLGDL